MLSFDEALERVLTAVVPLSAEHVSLPDAYGRVLAEDVLSPADLPAFDHSAMDGYALRSSDLSGQAPLRLLVHGESRAGHPAPELEAGSACRIFTGAPLPAGADSVVMQEDVRRDGEWVELARAPAPGEHVRHRAEDLARGSLALACGALLSAFELGLAAALDRTTLSVARQPRVAIVGTGDELRPPGAPGPAGTIPESNGVVIAALVRAAGGQVTLLERVGDDRAAIQRTLGRAASGSDVLVTIGGASVGDHDLVRQALTDAGAEVDFWKVRVKPGKPFLFGALGGARVLGLPGNPVSAQLSFVLFGLPLLRALQGHAAPQPPRARVRLGAELRQKPGRLGLYRARLEGDVAHPQLQQASGSSVSLAHADVVVLVPADSAGLPAGALVEAIHLPRP